MALRRTSSYSSYSYSWGAIAPYSGPSIFTYKPENQLTGLCWTFCSYMRR